MKKIKILLKYWFLVSLCGWAVYFLIWVIRSFVVFEFRNPFSWIVDLPYYGVDHHGAILFFWMGIMAIKITVTYHLMKKEINKQLLTN